MKKLTGLGSALDMAIEINKSIGLNSAAMGINQIQNELARKISPFQSTLDMIIQANRTLDIYNSKMMGMLGIAEVIRKNTFFGIPNSTMAAIDMIAKQHQVLFAGSSAMTLTMNATIGSSKLSSLQVALNGISGKMIRIAASTNNWGIIDDFEIVSSQAVELSENLAEDFQLSEETKVVFNKLVDLVVAFLKKNRKAGIYSLLFVDLVLRIASAHQYYDFLKAKPEMATREDIKKLETNLLRSIEEKLRNEKEFRITNRSCRVFLRPNLKSLQLAKLSSKSDVIVLQIKHKWS